MEINTKIIKNVIFTLLFEHTIIDLSKYIFIISSWEPHFGQNKFRVFISFTKQFFEDEKIFILFICLINFNIYHIYIYIYINIIN